MFLILDTCSRLAKTSLAFLLLRDTFTMLESAACELLLLIDLKDVFHSLILTEESKKYCRVLPYFDSASYLYQRMLMGINMSPAIWKS